MTMQVLVIAGDDDAAGQIEWMLIDEDIKLDVALTGTEGIAKARQVAFDVILLDPRLPDATGPEVLRKLRQAEVKAPVVIVSDRDGVEDMSRGFGFGADAYVELPADTNEQVAVIYKAAGWTGKPPFVARVGEFTLEFKRWLMINGKRVCLSAQEMQIVELLVRRRGETISTAKLREHLYKGATDVPELRLIDFFVSRARRLIAFHTENHRLIEIVRGKGYRFADPCETAAPYQ
jgi:DNA-binding response OmpR family regulator